MRVVIRTDASVRIGLGHLARCRTLAQCLARQGASVQFVCRAHVGNQIDDLRAQGFRVSALPAPSVQAHADADYAAWLGVTQEQDARETLKVLIGRPDWLIVDHYALDARWEQRLRPAVGRILVIDDLANRQHDADLLLDQNLTDQHLTDHRYADRVTPGTRCLLGPRYALLRPDYAEARRVLRRPEPDLGGREHSRLFVFFGGTDAENLSGLTLEALSHPRLSDLPVDLVIGVNNPHRDQLVAQAETRGKTRLHLPRPHLADLMAKADLAIGAGGAMTWERCCLGLPSLVVSVAENQRAACELMASRQVIAYLGHQDVVSADGLRHTIQGLLDHLGQRQQLARASAALVDGLGTERVVRAMQAIQAGQACAKS